MAKSGISWTARKGDDPYRSAGPELSGGSMSAPRDRRASPDPTETRPTGDDYPADDCLAGAGGKASTTTGAARRVHRRRTAGWRMPANTVYVGRGSIWGNPFRVGASRGDRLPPLTAAQVVRLFERWLTEPIAQPAHAVERALIVNNLHQLRGKNLACWCPLDQPCHADVLLRLAASALPGTAVTTGTTP
jgi:hypothetical protein